MQSEWVISDMHSEEKALNYLRKHHAGGKIAAIPMETPFIPSRARVLSAVPDIGYRLVKA